MIPIFSQIQEQGINFIDIGCRGELDKKWKSLFSALDYVGFDLDEQECRRLASLWSPYKSVRYLPYAIAGHVGQAELYATKAPYCWSLLKPRQAWLRRFEFADLFEVVGKSKVDCVTLDHLAETETLQADILKLDTQGLEVPILKAGTTLVQDAFCVELETGFIECYHEETVAAAADTFMREHGFLLFDITVHRVGRANPFAEQSRQQVMWCETLWLRDYLAGESQSIDVPLPERNKAVKALYICKALGFVDYGFELAGYFHSMGILGTEEMASLSERDAWTECD